jgi:hypothetical protein
MLRKLRDKYEGFSAEDVCKEVQRFGRTTAGIKRKPRRLDVKCDICI